MTTMEHLLLVASTVAILVGLGSLVYANYPRRRGPAYPPRRS
jgi:hypothetical protein